jgi:hypothetical protein
MTLKWAKSGMVGWSGSGDDPPAIHYIFNTSFYIILNL